MFSSRFTNKALIGRIEQELKSSFSKEDQAKNKLILRSGLLLEQRVRGYDSQDLMNCREDRLDITKQLLAMKVSKTKFPLQLRGNLKRSSTDKRKSSVC
ncbi:MAG: hypothetical protein ACI4ND_08240 [Succinivibrio sp.]